MLVGLGVASLSMAPASLPDVRGALALQTHDACHEIASAALEAPPGARLRSAAPAADPDGRAEGAAQPGHAVLSDQVADPA